MRIKTTLPNYDGTDLRLDCGLLLEVFQGKSLSTIQTELRHGTAEGDALKDVWYAGIFAYDGYADNWKLETKSKPHESKEAVLAAIKSEAGIIVNFSLPVWLYERRRQSNLQVLQAFNPFGR